MIYYGPMNKSFLKRISFHSIGDGMKEISHINHMDNNADFSRVRSLITPNSLQERNKAINMRASAKYHS